MYGSFLAAVFLAACGVLMLCIRAGASQTTHQLKSDTLEAIVTENGVVTHLGEAGADNLLAAAVEVVIREPLADRTIKDACTEPTKVTVVDEKLRIRKVSRQAELAWTHEFQASASLSWTITFENESDELRSLTVEFPVRLSGTDYLPFFTGPDDYPQWPEDGKLSYSFHSGSRDRNKMCVPVGCVYAEGQDVGFSVAADLDIPILPVEFTAQQRDGETEILFARPRVRLDPKSKRSITVHFVVHPGDWRSSLAWLRERWPECFWVPDGLEKYQNMSYWGSAALGYAYPYCFLHDLYWKNYMHSSFPWRTGVTEMMALHRWWGWGWAEVSDTGRWLPGIAVKWYHMQHYSEVYPPGFLAGMPPADAPYQEIAEFVESRSATPELRNKITHSSAHWTAPCWEWMTHDLVRQFIDTMHANGYYAFLYWNPRDVWYLYARDEFADTLIQGPQDEFGYTGAYCNPCPGSKFWQHRITEVERMLELYPELDGIFIDQCYGGGASPGYDDGVSIDEEGKTYSDFNRNLGSLCAEMARRVHAAGKHVWQNHCHESIGMTRYCDLALQEDRMSPGTGQELSRYITIGNRCCVSLENHESHLQVALRNGFYARLGWHYPDPRDRRLDGMWAHRLYYPLFDLLRGRHWVLEAHCLELPEGMDGNLFRRPDGNYLATLISLGETHISPWWRLNVPLMVQVADVEQIKAAYFISGDHLGPMKIPFDREGNAITVTLPHHRSASMVLLAKTGQFVSLASPALVQRNTGETITLAMDNFTDEPWPWRGTLWLDQEAGWGEQQEPEQGQHWERVPARWLHWEQVPAQSEITVDVPLTTTVAPSDPFFAFRLAMDVVSDIPSPDAQPDNYATFELLAEEAPTVTIAPSRRLITRCLSNSAQGGYLPFYEVMPLHLYVGETAEFEVGMTNSTASPQEVTLKLTGQGIRLEDGPATISVPARGGTRLALRATGQVAGAGAITATVRSEAGEETFTLALRVVARALTESQLAQVKSVELIADVWGQTRQEPQKPILLNGTEVGHLTGAHSSPTWTTRAHTELTEAAVAALRGSNEIEIRNPGQDNYKVRNPVLVITLDDGTVLHLAGDTRVRSTPPEWLRAEGKRVAAGNAFAWRIPAT